MSSACRNALLLVALLCFTGLAQPRELRVCADPDNLPFSDASGNGFENRIARLVAEEMGAELRYEWLPLRRGFVRNLCRERHEPRWRRRVQGAARDRHRLGQRRSRAQPQRLAQHRCQDAGRVSRRCGRR